MAAKRKPTPAQLEARRLFAERARSGAFKRKAARKNQDKCGYCGGPGGVFKGPGHIVECPRYEKSKRRVKTIGRRKSNPSPAQLRARRLFAERARSGAFKRKKNFKIPKGTGIPEFTVAARSGKQPGHWDMGFRGKGRKALKRATSRGSQKAYWRRSDAAILRKYREGLASSRLPNPLKFKSEKEFEAWKAKTGAAKRRAPVKRKRGVKATARAIGKNIVRGLGMAHNPKGGVRSFLTGAEVSELMRQHKITTPTLAKRMQITQKRVKQVRKHGVKGSGFARDWVQGITGKDPLKSNPRKKQPGDFEKKVYSVWDGQGGHLGQVEAWTKTEAKEKAQTIEARRVQHGAPPAKKLELWDTGQVSARVKRRGNSSQGLRRSKRKLAGTTKALMRSGAGAGEIRAFRAASKQHARATHRGRYKRAAMLSPSRLPNSSWDFSYRGAGSKSKRRAKSKGLTTPAGRKFSRVLSSSRLPNPRPRGVSKRQYRQRRTTRALRQQMVAFRQHGIRVPRRRTGPGRLPNPRGQHLAGLPAKFQRMYEDILASARASGRYKGREKEVAARTVRAAAEGKRNPYPALARLNPGVFNPLFDTGPGRRALATYLRRERKAGRRGMAKAALGQWKRQGGIPRKTWRAPMKPRRFNNPVNPLFGPAATKMRRVGGPRHIDKAPRGKGGKAARRIKGMKGFAGARARAYYAHSKKQSTASRWKNIFRLGNPSPADVYSEFRGKNSTTQRQVKAATGTPSRLAKLGGLRELKLRGRALRFGNGAALGADARKRLHITGVRLKVRGNDGGGEVDMGEVISVTYRADKPHIEEGVIDYIHKFGEEGGTRPHLIVDPEGYPVLEGGSYDITADGIID